MYYLFFNQSISPGSRVTDVTNLRDPQFPAKTLFQNCWQFCDVSDMQPWSMRVPVFPVALSSFPCFGSFRLLPEMTRVLYRTSIGDVSTISYLGRLRGWKAVGTPLDCLTLSSIHATRPPPYFA